MSDPEILAAVRSEAEAMIAEAQDQASRMLKAAEALRQRTGLDPSQINTARAGLERQIEETIAQLTEVLNQLRSIESQ